MNSIEVVVCSDDLNMLFIVLFVALISVACQALGWALMFKMATESWTIPRFTNNDKGALHRGISDNMYATRLKTWFMYGF